MEQETRRKVLVIGAGVAVVILILVFSYINRASKFPGWDVMDVPFEVGKPIELSGKWLLYGRWLGVGPRPTTPPGSLKIRKLYVAEVPGTVYRPLRRAEEIEDPYKDRNCEGVQWVNDKEWWYFKKFRVPPAAEAAQALLTLHGISYRADVWLNGSHLGSFAGMFNRQEWPVSEQLRYGEENLLAVRVEGPLSEDGARPLRRTEAVICQMSYGWDFAPKLIPIGIWRPVTLEFVRGARLNDLQVTSTIQDDKAAVTVGVQVTGQPAEATLKATIVRPGGAEPHLMQEVKVAVPAEGAKEVKLEFTIPKPALWWPNGMGEQPLYEVELDLVGASGDTTDSAGTRFGIRHIRMIASDGEPEAKWTFEVNGKKTFMKGANWVPVDSMFHLHPERYRWLLTLAKEAGMNMLRVWGGGISEQEPFYRLCDELGLLVWQEFWLSIGEYHQLPSEILEDCARDAVLELRNHPSLALWCGGNEFDPDSNANRPRIDSLEQICETLDPGRPFLRSSPYNGDDHHWGVWHQMQPYTMYANVSRFRSEAGLQAVPRLESLRRFLSPVNLQQAGVVWTYHAAQLEKLKRYAMEYGSLRKLPAFIQATQLAQGLGVQFGVEAERAHKFWSNGFLVWQLNEPWPAISWSMIDWYGEPKPAYYFFKRAAEPLHISAEYRSYVVDPGSTFEATVYVANDLDQPFDDLTATARILQADTLEDLYKPDPPARKEAKLSVAANASREALRIAWPVPKDLPSAVLFLQVELKDSAGQVRSSGLYWIATSPYVWPDEHRVFEGEWAFKGDPDRVGEEGGWYKPETDISDWGKINVPGPWNAEEAGEKAAWYRRDFEIPESWKGTDLELKLKVVDGHKLFLNGRKIGESAETQVRAYRIEEKDLNYGGQNCICILVTGTPDGDGGLAAPLLRAVPKPEEVEKVRAHRPVCFTPLGSWPKAKLSAKPAEPLPTDMNVGEEKEVQIAVTNEGDTLAFFVELRFLGPLGVLALLEDNYFALMPGETKTVGLKLLCRSKAEGPEGAAAIQAGQLLVGAWNTPLARAK